jgi:ParB family protein of integrating conjugative element (PFGI_1 class)
MSARAAGLHSSAGPLAQDALEFVYLDVAAIRAYEHNPRRATNGQYDRIKASIRVDGLSQPLVVTQRPGESDYVVHAGGNTRLRILSELFAQTGERRFGTVACVVRPWTCEADVLLAHLKENDLRGELTFLDKALGVADARRFLQEESADELTQAALANVLTQRGYALSQPLVSQMSYAVERLLPWLPKALESGIGRPQIARIRALDREARALWLECVLDAESEYDPVFEALCRRYDTPDWDLANLRRAIEAEIAERADLSIQAVSLVFDARLAGHRVSPPERSGDVEFGDAAGRDVGSESEAEETSANGSPAPNAGAQSPRQPTGSAPESPSSDRTQPATQPDAARGEDVPVADAMAAVGVPIHADVKSLRARLWTLASRLAQRNGLSDLVQPLSGQGLGFVLSDVPDPALVDQLDEDALAQVSMVWWHLAACAELTVAPLDTLLPALPQESVLRRALVEQDAGALFAGVWTLDPGQTGYRLWRRLNERDWQDLLGLMATYRALHATAAASGQDLWSPT